MREPVAPSIIEFVTDPQLLGLSISLAQKTLLKSIYGEPLDRTELDVFRRCTGRATYPAHVFPEVTVISGAQSGKNSRVGCPLVVYESVFGGHEALIEHGEPVRIVLVAQDRAGTDIALSYVRDAFTRPLLASRVARVLASSIELTNGLIIECYPCTKSAMRGRMIPLAVMDEVAFYRLEGSVNEDREIETSIRRGQIAIPAAKLIKISTPYMRSGLIYEDHKTYFGTDSPDVLIWQSSSAEMNPERITTSQLARAARVTDPARYRREYEAIFSEDVRAFLADAWIESAIMIGRGMLPYQPGLKYVGAVDTSGGGDDAFTLSIVHAEGQGATRRVVQDICRGWSKPRAAETNLEGAVQEIAAIVRSYGGLSTVYSDRYAARWPREAFKRYGVAVVDATVRGPDGTQTYLDRSAAYLEVEPLFAAGLIAIVDNPTLHRELRNLERRPSQGGKDRIDHPRGQHDDYSNALCLAAAIAGQGRSRPVVYVPDGITRIGEPAPARVGVIGQAPLASRGEVGGQARFVMGSYTPRWFRHP